MDQKTKNQLGAVIADFHMPAYNEIPNVGLYLDQVTKFVSEYLQPLEGVTITSSMISNYVKKKMIANPVRKMYDRVQIAEILFIAVAKSVLALEDIQSLLELQRSISDTKDAYTLFCTELEKALHAIFAGKTVEDSTTAETTSICSDTTAISADTTTINSDTVSISSDTTAISSDITAISSATVSPAIAASTAAGTASMEDELFLLHRLIITITNKIYLETYFAAMKGTIKS